LEKKVSEINQDIIVSLETIAEQESLLSDEDRDKREKAFQGYADRFKKLPLEERLKRQKKYTIQHLNKAEINIYDLKEMLKKLGFYQGEINNKFNEELAASISKFQEKYHVTPIDGTCGPKTLSKLREIIASD
jgi:peptidoglycan hydrolase-like protein with peptidoglycan-binding domain